MSDTGLHAAPEGGPAEATFEGAGGSKVTARPQLFGKYELLARIRVGGMAEIFRAREIGQLDRTLALKRILPSFTDEADYVAMFIDEARLGLRLKHRAIIEAYELGQVDDDFYIALEFVEGIDAGVVLRRARERNQPLPIAVACYIASEVCAALEYAHGLTDEQGEPLSIVHRDVSPQNLLLSRTGEVKLIDFGIAKSADQWMRTQAGLLKGKHGYLSPEQAMIGEIDQRSDLFSLGICLYEMLAARRLFQGANDFSTLIRVRAAQVPPLAEQNPQVPEALARIVEKALARDREARFASAAEFGAELDAFMQASGMTSGREALAALIAEIAAEAPPSDPAAAREQTGLLDAFESVDPVSAVSVLAPAEPSDGAPGKVTLQGVPAPPPPAEPGEFAASAEPADPGDEPSTGMTRAAADPGAAEPDAVAAEPEPPPVALFERRPAHGPQIATLPGIGMEWDDEELSTQIYDPPESLPGRLESYGAPAAPPALAQAPAPPAAAAVPSTFAAPLAMTDSVPAARRARSSGALVWIAAGCASLAVIGSAALFLTAPAATATLSLPTEPPDARATLDGRESEVNASPFIFSSVEPDVYHQVEVSKPGYRTWSARLLLQPGNELQLPLVKLIPVAPAAAPDPAPAAPTAVQPDPAPAPPIKKPEAAGQPMPPRPKPAPAEPPPGPAAAAPAAPSADRPVPAAAAAPPSPEPAEPAVLATKGILRLNSRPWSRVQVDGKLVGTTPQVGIVLEAGRHTVTLTNPEFGLERVITVQITAGQTLTRSVDLTEPAQAPTAREAPPAPAHD